MKRHLLRLFVIISFFSLLTGCIATHSGNMTGSASLSGPNFIYQKQNISGESKATYVLGIGGVARQSLILEAKKNMLKSNPLLRDQALANISVSYKTTGFLGVIVTTVRCIVSADIVEFDAVQTDLSQPQPSNSTSVLPAEKRPFIENKTGDKKVDVIVQSL